MKIIFRRGEFILIWGNKCFVHNVWYSYRRKAVDCTCSATSFSPDDCNYIIFLTLHSWMCLVKEELKGGYCSFLVNIFSSVTSRNETSLKRLFYEHDMSKQNSNCTTVNQISLKRSCATWKYRHGLTPSQSLGKTRIAGHDGSIPSLNKMYMDRINYCFAIASYYKLAGTIFLRHCFLSC